MPRWMKGTIGACVLVAFAVAAFFGVVAIVAATKDMGIIEYMKTWGEVADTVKEPVTDAVEQAIASFNLR